MVALILGNSGTYTVEYSAKLLFCKQTNACGLKNLAEKAGYIGTAERYRVLGILEKADMSALKGLDSLAGKKACRIKCRRTYNNFEAIEVLYQMYDEIAGKVKFTTRKKIWRLRSKFTSVSAQSLPRVASCCS